MPRLTNSNPSYCRHRASGQAIVTIDGKDFYFGPWGSAASRREYDRILAEWLANGRRAPLACTDITVVELIDRFWSHATEYYRRPDGSPTSEIATFEPPLRLLKTMYGTIPAAHFGPLALEALRLKMIAKGWCRNVVNAQVNRVRHMFRWAVSKELLAGEVIHRLEALAPLRAGRTNVRESDPVTPVADEVVEATLPHLSSVVACMVRVQRLTGARPGEICTMRTADITRTGDVWEYRPRHHKNS